MAKTAAQFPEVQGGGSLIVAWQVKGKTVLVVGGGEVRAPTSGKIPSAIIHYFTNLIPLNRSPRAASSTASTPTPS